MRTFVSELRRRNVFRAAAFYAASAWLVVQVATQVFPFFDVPNWAVRWIVIAAVVGFPFMIALRVVLRDHARGPEARERNRSAASRSTRETGTEARSLDHRGDGVSPIVLLLANKFVMRKDDGRARRKRRRPPKSIAVLPFTDLSPVARSGIFLRRHRRGASQRAGEAEGSQGRGPHVVVLVQGQERGSPRDRQDARRRQHPRRFAAQAGRQGAHHRAADPGVGRISPVVRHVRRRSFGDVFALQERIARAIADKLEIVLKGGAAQRIVPVTTTNAGGVRALPARRPTSSTAATARISAMRSLQLEQAITLDPKARALHARLAAIYAIASTYMPRTRRGRGDLRHGGACAHRERARSDARRAVTARLAQSLLHPSPLSPMRAHAFERARADRSRMTRHPRCGARRRCIMTGLPKAWETTMLDHLLAIDPKLPIAQLWRGVSYANAGDMPDAERLLQRRGRVEARVRRPRASDRRDGAPRQPRGDPCSSPIALSRRLDTSLPTEGVGSARRRASSAMRLPGRAARRDDRHAELDDASGSRARESLLYALVRMGEPARALAVVRMGSPDER